MTANHVRSSSALGERISFPLVKRLDPSLRPVDVFQRLSMLPHAVFLDSAMRHPQLGRYSFVAADPVEWLAARADNLNALNRLADRVATLPLSARNDLPPFQGGWAGLFGYELGGNLERVPPAAIDEFKLPALAIGLYDVVIAFDHQQGTAWLLSQGFPEHEEALRRDRAEARLSFFRELLHAADHKAPSVQHLQLEEDFHVIPVEQLAPQFAVGGLKNLTSNFSADAYRRAVQQVIDYIYAGDVFQVNLSQRLLHPASSSAIELYCRLRERNPAPFAGFLDGGNWQLASASPERFIEVTHGRVETRPIKGTRRRSPHPVADMFTGGDLRASAKDQAENVMIVDLLRNDLSRTCRPDSVHVSQLFGLETYEYVQHLVSVVEGQLRPEFTPLDVLRTSFPGGSVTGAPKIRAMEIIAELEPTVRGPYCGCLGYIGVGGRMDTSILIRTITAAGGWWQLPVGGGIVVQSDPREEYDETWHKAAGLLRALV
jgi:para-aminobenzoate synthetase component I